MHHYHSFLTFFIFFISFSSLSATSTPDYTTIDEHAKNAPDELRSSVADLTTYLIKPAKNDTEKVRAMFTWLAMTIKYNVRALESPSKIQRTKEERILRTLKYKRAVCQGYSEVFEAMCQEAGLNVAIVIGWNKSNKEKSNISKEPNHAWNAVQLDGEWYLLDATWAAGHVKPSKSGKNRFVRKFNDSHFLTPPATFVYRHLPADPAWQLLDCPIEKETFKAGATVIQNKIASSEKCYSYKDTLQIYVQLEPLDKKIATAKRAYEFDDNKKCKRILGSAYLRKSKFLLEQEATLQGSKEEKITYYDNVTSVLSTALEFAPTSNVRKYLASQLSRMKKKQKML